MRIVVDLPDRQLEALGRISKRRLVARSKGPAHAVCHKAAADGLMDGVGMLERDGAVPRPPVGDAFAGPSGGLRSGKLG